MTTTDVWTIADQEKEEWDFVWAAAEADSSLKGRVVSIIGPVVDVEFAPEALPEINFALKINRGEVEGQRMVVTAEVAQHIGHSRVRAVCMQPTDGMVRGAVAVNTQKSMTMPVGKATLGRVINVIGEVIDKGPRIEPSDRWEIHRSPPEYTDLEPKSELLETGIKVIDLLAPYVKG